jgi:hypothetical protein
MKKSQNLIKEIDLIAYYQDYYNMSLEEFRARSLDIIKTARAPNVTLMESLKKMMSKDSILTSVNNFVQKGHGYGVL